jgi:hypothetical protein
MPTTPRRRWHLIDPRCRRGASRGTFHAYAPEWIVRAVATLRRMDYCRPGDSLIPATRGCTIVRSVTVCTRCGQPIDWGRLCDSCADDDKARPASPRSYATACRRLLRGEDLCADRCRYAARFLLGATPAEYDRLTPAVLAFTGGYLPQRGA